MMLVCLSHLCFAVAAVKQATNQIARPATSNACGDQTRTIYQMATQTHYDTVVMTQHVYYTRYATIKSEIQVPDTTIIQTHHRTVHSDHYTTVTPPTVTFSKTITESHYKTTMTLPIQTEIIERYMAPTESSVIWKFIGNLSFTILLMMGFGLFLHRRGIVSSRISQEDDAAPVLIES